LSGQSCWRSTTDYVTATVINLGRHHWPAANLRCIDVGVVEIFEFGDNSTKVMIAHPCGSYDLQRFARAFL
jgi:hypothetical protein